MSSSRTGAWLFSPAIDLAVFGGAGVASLALLAVGHALGVLHEASPAWTWLLGVLLIDVAHVHLTFARVYLDPVELRAHPWRYALAPTLTFAAGFALYDQSPAVFWRALAYLAVFHFVRQQVGWMRLYHARARALAPWRKRLDIAAIYLATLHPLAWWHAHLPRRFDWFVDGDFAHIPAGVAQAVSAASGVLWALALGACFFDSARRWIARREGELGRDVLLATTAACWYVGVVVFNSDFAFTVTNVFIHGVPYFALVYLTGRERAGERAARTITARVFRRAPWVLFALVWVTAFIEEFLWDRGVWAERAWLFGRSATAFDEMHPWLVPLLAVPQASHYVLDGIIWRRSEAPELARVGTNRDGA